MMEMVMHCSVNLYKKSNVITYGNAIFSGRVGSTHFFFRVENLNPNPKFSGQFQVGLSGWVSFCQP